MISSKNSMREGSIRVPQREPFFAAYYRVMSSLCKMCDVLRSSLTSRAWPRSSSNHTWKNGKDKSPLRGGAGVGMPAIVGIISGKIAEERGGEFSRVNQRGQLLLDNFSKQQWCKGCIKLPSSSRYERGCFLRFTGCKWELLPFHILNARNFNIMGLLLFKLRYDLPLWGLMGSRAAIT